MNIPVIVMGAAGRMGSTLTRLVRESNDLTLCGAVERKEKFEDLSGLPCKVEENLSALLPGTPGLTVIDFTAPAASLETARLCAANGAKLIVGTTGFSADERAELESLALKTPVFWSPNMSVGINVLLKILPELTRLLGEDYDVDMVELHHNKKKDAPSGTAVRLAECLAKAKGWLLEDSACYSRHGIIGERPKKEIGLQTIRGGDVVGVHTMYFMGPGERIEVTHQAHSRENFANGALRAVRWLASQNAGKLYSMTDVF